MKMLRVFVTAIAGLVLTGCATVNPMAFNEKSTAIDTREKSIVLMTVDVSRNDKSRFVPEPFVIRLEKPNAQSKEERQNFTFAKDADALQENGHSVYLVRLALAPGDYKLQNVSGMASAFPIVGSFNVPLSLDLKVAPGSVTYVGRVRATLRERVGNEFRAGPVIPLIDQSIAGMSGGTWDVSIEHLEQKDLALFRSRYPVLNNVSIAATPLPPFDRALVQREWDGETRGTTNTVASAGQSAGVAAK